MCEKALIIYAISSSFSVIALFKLFSYKHYNLISGGGNNDKYKLSYKFKISCNILLLMVLSYVKDTVSNI